MRRQILRHSDALLSAGYDEASSILEVEFKSEAVYQFAGVPRHLFFDLVGSKAPGRFFANFIKAHYIGRLIRDTHGNVPDSGN